MTSENSLGFECFTLDLDRLCLYGPSGRVDLRRKSFDVLRYLVEHAGRVISKGEVLNAVWPDSTVGDESLTQCISEIRRALDDKGQRIIKTIARRGYLVDLPISRNTGTRPAPALQCFDSPPIASGPASATTSHGTLEPAPTMDWGAADLAGRVELEESRENLPKYQTPRREAGEFGSDIARFDPPQPNARAYIDTTAKTRGRFSVYASFAWVVNRRSHMLVTGIALAAGLTIFGSLIWTTLRPAPSTARTMMAAPTVALRPFAMPGSEDGQRSLAAALEAEIRSELARAHRGFDLIIRPASEDPGRASLPKFASTPPEARYVVIGTTWVDLVGEHASIQLIETETNRQIWSESFELNHGQNGAFNRTAARIARIVIVQIRAAESELPVPAKVEAGHYALIGRTIHESERGRDSTRRAQSLFEKALELDANSVPALLGLAQTKLLQAHNGWIPTDQRASVLIEAGNAIERLVKLNPGNAAGHWLRASLSRALGEVDKAIPSLEYALLLNPNFFAAHAELGRIKIDAGRAHEALGHIEEALQLVPPESNIHYIYFFAGMAALHISDDPAAVQWLLKARHANPAFDPAQLWLAAAYLMIGEEEAARATMADFLKGKPEFSIARFKQFVPVRNPIAAKQRERIIDAWRRLGVPEGTMTAATH